MKCNYCGFEHEENLNFCPRCGRQTFTDVISLNPTADRLSNAFTDGLFLTICILMSVSCLFSFLSGGIPVFPILFTVFLWLGFAQGKRGFVDQTHVRSASGTLFAYYIVTYVSAGLILLLGVLLSLLFSLIGSSPFILEEFMEEAEFASFAEAELFTGFLGIAGGLFLIICLVMAAVLILFNVFGIRKIHKFVQSVYRSVEYNENRIVCAKAARTWLIVLGSLSLATALFALLTTAASATAAASEISHFTTATATTSAISIITSACNGLCGIFAGVLINKHFVNA